MSTPVPTSSAKLSTGQVIRLFGCGIVIWAAGALLLRTIAPMGGMEGANRIGLYAAIFIGTWPFVVAVTRLAALGPDQIVRGVSFVTFIALFIDGSVFAWAPTVYGTAAHHLDNAAAVLWGGGSGLLLAFIAENRTVANTSV